MKARRWWVNGGRTAALAARMAWGCAACIGALANTGCGASGGWVWADSLQSTDAELALQEALVPGDRLDVQVLGQPDMSGERVVGSDGLVAIPTLGSLKAAGTTPQGFQKLLTDRLRSLLAQPNATVVLLTRATIRVNALGEVGNPGRIELQHGDGVIEALAAAGGLTAFADPDAIFVLRTGADGRRVRFRYDDLKHGEPRSVGFDLHAGDLVFVE